MTSLIVTFGNGDSLPIDIETTAPYAPPTNVLHPHEVVFGTKIGQQFTVTLTPGELVTVVQPDLPPAVRSRLASLPIFDDQFLTSEEWGTTWSNNWFNSEKFNGLVLDSSLITFAAGGGVVLGVSDGGKTGCLINTNPNNPNVPGFQFSYGYWETTATIVAGGWPAIWSDGQTWPQDGEDDVFEWIGGATSNYHSGGPTGSSTDHPNNSGILPGTWTGQHRFGELRTPDNGGTNYIYWDGVLVRQYPTYDKGAPHYLIYSVGNATNGGGGPMAISRCTVWNLSA